MFSYQINKNIKLKILEEREARRRLKIVNTLSIRRCNNLSMVMDFIVEYGVIKN